MSTNDTGPPQPSAVGSMTELGVRGQVGGPPSWDTSDPFFSAHTRDVIVTMFQCYVRQLVIFIGIPGNVLCCAVFLKQGVTDRINLLLCSLAVADLVNLVSQLLRIPGCYLSDKVDAANWEIIANTKIVYVSLWASYVSGVLIVIISVDRCLSVAMPLKARKLLTYRPMVAAIVLTYLVHLAYFFPSFLGFTVRWKVDPSTNRSMAYMALTDLFSEDEGGIPTEVLMVLSLSTKPFSLLLVVVCCIITILTLRKASRQRRQMTGSVKQDEHQDGDTRITKMLLILCLVYVVLTIPEVSSAIAYPLVPGYFLFQKYHNTFIVVCVAIIDTASCINSTANFFAYVLMSSKFKKTLKDLCPCYRASAPVK